MGNINKFISRNKATTQITNRWSSGGVATAELTEASAFSCKATVSGSISANTLIDVLNITNHAGTLDIVAACSNTTTTMTHRIKITLDGVVVFDATSASGSGTNQGMVAIGGVVRYASTNYQPIPRPTAFNNSCLVQYAPSISGSSKALFLTAYTLTD